MAESHAHSQRSDRQIYKQACSFLFDLKAPHLTRALVESYLVAPVAERPADLNGLYARLLFSAQNAGMRPSVIGGSIGGVGKLDSVLKGFDPAWVVAHYSTDSHRLLDDIIKRLKPNGQIRRTSRSLWPQYCKTALSAAAFLERFTSAKDFFSWVEFFDGDSRARPGLPLIVSEEVKGFGFALACDFLKELGYANFGKPDVHIREIFAAAGLCLADASDYELLKAICRIADNVGVPPYTVDKVFWLIGSGYFYNHPQVGKSGRIPQPKASFIASLKPTVPNR